MGTKRKTAPLWRRGNLFVVRPGWNDRVEFSFTDRGNLLEWARSNKLILKEVGNNNGGKRYGAT